MRSAGAQYYHQHARTLSEAELFSLSFSDLKQQSHSHSSSGCCSRASISSSPPIANALGLYDCFDSVEFPMLSPSAVEDQEHQFAQDALLALQHMSISDASTSIQMAKTGNMPHNADFSESTLADQVPHHPTLPMTSGCDSFPSSPSSVPDVEGQIHPFTYYKPSENYHRACGTSPSSSSSSSSTSSSFSVSPTSSLGTEEDVDDYLSFKSKQLGQDTVDDVTPCVSPSPSQSPSLSPSPSLATRRGRTMKIQLPPRPTTFYQPGSTPGEESDRTTVTPPNNKNFESLHHPIVHTQGLLRNNFGGVKLRRSSQDEVVDCAFEAPEGIKLRTRRSNNFGFAF